MNFRPIRIALNLSLIVAMTSQPVLGLSFSEPDGGRRGDQQQACPGCGRCAVEATIDHCCCCGSAETEKSHNADLDRRDVVVAKAQDGIAEREIAADCRCGITTIPMDRRHHRQSTGDFTKLRIGSLPIVDLLSKADPQSFHLQRAHRGDANRRGRYSQQYLCVWRI